MRNGQKGAALITTVLVMLVLTVMGISLAIMTTREDRTSARMEHHKAAFYAAEAGLRRGEAVLRGTVLFSVGLLLQHVPVAATPVVNPQVPVHPVANDVSSWTVNRLGTYLVQDGVELANREVTLGPGMTGFGGGGRAFYSVYIRNNPEDLGGPTSNSDTRVRLVSVGWIARPDGQPLAVKVLEEEFNYVGVPQMPSAQKQGHEHGTGSGSFGG